MRFFLKGPVHGQLLRGYEEKKPGAQQDVNPRALGYKEQLCFNYSALFIMYWYMCQMSKWKQDLDKIEKPARPLLSGRPADSPWLGGRRPRWRRTWRPSRPGFPPARDRRRCQRIPPESRTCCRCPGSLECRQ